MIAWKRITTTGAAAFAALTMISVAPAYAASAAPSRGATPTASAAPAISVQTTGVHLTATQAAALRSAVKLNPKLTAEQAARLTGARPVTGAGLAPNGHGQASGPCGTASLFGYSNGSYGLALFFNATVGPPVVGSVAISTNGIFPSTDYYGIPPVSDSGRLADTGAIPDATTANGWAVTSNAWYCGIAVTAYW
jgi:hypothetical protein